MAKGISRQRIVQAALELLDEQGLEGLTARALADRLGVKAPALYWHVASKQVILDEMATEVRRRMVLALADEPVPEGWREGLVAYARVIRAEYLRHRDGARTFSGARVTDPEVLRVQQLWMERWTQSGLCVAHATAAVQLVTAFVVGFVIEEQAMASTDRFLLTASDPAVAAEVPLVAAAGKHLVADADRRFEEYLDVVLTGIADRFDTAPPADA